MSALSSIDLLCKPLKANLIWSETIVKRIAIRKSLSYAKLKELAFLSTRKRKPATSQPDEEWLPCTKKDVFLAVADIRIPSNVKCVSAYLTAIRGTLLEDSINIRVIVDLNYSLA